MESINFAVGLLLGLGLPFLALGIGMRLLQFAFENFYPKLRRRGFSALTLNAVYAGACISVLAVSLFAPFSLPAPAGLILWAMTLPFFLIYMALSIVGLTKYVAFCVMWIALTAIFYVVAENFVYRTDEFGSRHV